MKSHDSIKMADKLCRCEFRIFVLSILFFVSLTFADRLTCDELDFGEEKIVCVCNTTYCDTIEPNTPLPHSQYAVYTSSKSGLRFAKSVGEFTHLENNPSHPILTVKPNVMYQEVTGFGGAMTDAAAINIAKLEPRARDLLLKAYFSNEGIEYNIIRVNMAGCDFSTRVYSYDDCDGDFNLTKFSLAPEDINYKIPLIKYAQHLSNETIKVLASPWSAPAWMKTNHLMYGQGSLKGPPGGKYYKTWANYFVKFLEAYTHHGVRLWGLTALNEPLNGFIYNFSFNCMGMTAEDERDFIASDLGPALNASGFSHVKLMILDGQRFALTEWAETTSRNKYAMQYISGIAVHWYWDWIVPAAMLTKTHQLFPNLFILGTEACIVGPGKKVDLGNWTRGEQYAHDIIEDLNHYVVGWTDWNLALDLQGGPNWANNYVDSPIIVDHVKQIFYKQPMFYVMGHFSKFIKPGCRRIGVTASASISLEYTAFICHPNSVVMVIFNREETSAHIGIHDTNVGYITIDIAAHSIQTFTWVT